MSEKLIDVDAIISYMEMKNPYIEMTSEEIWHILKWKAHVY